MNEAKNVLQVGTAILTDTCVKRMELLQEQDNDTIEMIVSKILRSIMYISLDPNNDDRPEVIKSKHELVSDLAIIVEWIEELKAP